MGKTYFWDKIVWDMGKTYFGDNILWELGQAYLGDKILWDNIEFRSSPLHNPYQQV